MLVFPQLSTGASGQFPIARTRSRRTVVNELADGRVVRFADEFAEAAWDVDLKELSSAERSAVEALFVASEGRLRSFTFLDPAGNLLAFSELLSDDAWTRDPLVAVTAGVSDPLGTTRASHLINSGLANQGVGQALDVPASFVYCWSAWVKGSGTVTFSIGSLTRTFPVSDAWTRIEWGASQGGSGTAVTFEFALVAGSAVDAFGLQVEAQPGASGYKVTGAQAGVYANARFAADELKIVAEGLERERAQLRIVAVTEN